MRKGRGGKEFGQVQPAEPELGMEDSKARNELMAWIYHTTLKKGRTLQLDDQLVADCAGRVSLALPEQAHRLSLFERLAYINTALRRAKLSESVRTGRLRSLDVAENTAVKLPATTNLDVTVEEMVALVRAEQGETNAIIFEGRLVHNTPYSELARECCISEELARKKYSRAVALVRAHVRERMENP